MGENRLHDELSPFPRRSELGRDNLAKDASSISLGLSLAPPPSDLLVTSSVADLSKTITASTQDKSLADLQQQLAELDYELQEGDITEKGYRKRRAQLLASYEQQSDPAQIQKDNSLSSPEELARRLELLSEQYSQRSTYESSINQFLSRADTLIEPDPLVTERFSKPSSELESLYPPQSIDSSLPFTISQLPYTQSQDFLARAATRDLSPEVTNDFSKLTLQLPLEPRELSDAGPDSQMAKYDNLASILRQRGRTTSRLNAFVTLDTRGKESSAITWDKLSARAEKVGQVIREKSGLYRGDRVALLYRDCELLDFAVALLGCFLAGVVAVPINMTSKFSDITYILKSTQSHLALTTDVNLKSFHRDFTAQGKSWPRGVEWWKTNEFGSYHPPKKTEPPALQVPDLAYIEYSHAPTGELRGVVMSHKTVMHQMICLSSILSSKTKNPSRKPSGQLMSGLPTSYQTVMSYLDPRQSIGMIIGVLMTIYSGNTMIWLPSSTLATPGLYVYALSRHKPSIILADYPGLKQVAYNYQSLPLATRNYSKKYPADLSNIRWCLIDCLTVDPEFHGILADRWLRPLGNKNSSLTIAPMLTLSEHGGMVISMRDWIGRENQLGCTMPEIESSKPSDLAELYLDKKSLSTNNVKILSTNKSPDGFEETVNRDIIRVGAFGYPLPDATLAIVDPETSTLTAELIVGEVWVDSPSLSGGFWGLGRETELIFHARCWGAEGTVEMEFLRTGLLGFIYAGKVYILGLYEDRLRQRIDPEELDATEAEANILNPVPQYRYHYTAHLVPTIMQYIPRVFDSSAFDVFVNDERLPVILLESAIAITTPETPTGPPRELDVTKLETMASLCIKKLREIHNVRVYCVLITAPNTLPRTIRNGRSVVGTMLCRKDFESGSLPCIYVKFDIDRAVSNIAIDKHVEEMGGIWSEPSSVFRDQVLVNEDKQYSGLDEREIVMDDRTGRELTKFSSIVDILQWRVSGQPEELAFCTIDTRSRESKSTTWKKFDAKLAAVATYLTNRCQLKPGDNAVLIYTHGEEFVLAVYACMILGIVALPLHPLDPDRLNEDVPALLGVISDYKVRAILVNTEIDHALKQKATAQHLKQSAHAARVTMCPIYNTMKHGKVNLSCKDLKLKVNPKFITPGRPAISWMYWTSDQRRTTVSLAHDTILEMCKIQKETCQMSYSLPLLACARSTNGLGFLHTCLLGIYVGASTYLLSPVDFAASPQLWPLSLARYKVKDTYATPQMVDHAMTGGPLKAGGGGGSSSSLSDLRNVAIPFDSRPRTDLFAKMRFGFASIGLDGTAINSVYTHAMNVMVTTRSYMSIEPVELKIDMRELRRGYVVVAPPQEGNQHQRFVLSIQDSGMVPINTHVAVVHPETRRLCRASEFGEIWVASKANAVGFWNGTSAQAMKMQNPLDTMRFEATTAEADSGSYVYGDKNLKYGRTGDLGFLRTVARPVGPGGSMVDIQVLFILGAIGDTFEVSGLNHFAVDIEATIERSHRSITRDGSAVFQAGGLVVAVVESTSRTSILAALVPVIVNAVLNEHQLVLDVITFVGKGNFSRSRLNEKQRGRILAAWVTRRLKIAAQFRVSNRRAVAIEQ
ncbi:uncharacterized protein V1516DRAFT_475464 [Lipomyces oligophaga]|uniref:uncharacterized protein n=1 Tax=Lipomyces oligophaga TaxID=45792 RepID=UPI0034CE2AFC